MFLLKQAECWPSWLNDAPQLVGGYNPCWREYIRVCMFVSVNNPKHELFILLA